MAWSRPAEEGGLPGSGPSNEEMEIQVYREGHGHIAVLRALLALFGIDQQTGLNIIYYLGCFTTRLFWFLKIRCSWVLAAGRGAVEWRLVTSSLSDCHSTPQGSERVKKNHLDI